MGEVSRILTLIIEVSSVGVRLRDTTDQTFYRYSLSSTINPEGVVLGGKFGWWMSGKLTFQLCHDCGKNVVSQIFKVVKFDGPSIQFHKEFLSNIVGVTSGL